MRLAFTLIFSFIYFSTIAQKAEGTWVMAYIKAKQPVLSATMEMGELVFDEGAPVDSSEVYTPGLMLLQFNSAETAQSYSWDGNESWQVKLMGDSMQMFSKKDTLFGSFTPEKMVLSSTIDAVPTAYTFLKVSDQLKMTNITSGQSAKISSKDHPFDGLVLTFEQDTVITNATDIPGLELYLTNIGPLQVIEYGFDRDNSKVELGIIYLFSEKRRRFLGLFYPVIDDFKRPKSLELELKVK